MPASSPTPRESKLPARIAQRHNFRDFDNEEWWIPTRGVRLPKGMDDVLARSSALVAVQPDAVLSDATAAALLGCSVRSSTAKIETVTPPDSAGVRRQGHRRRRRDLAPGHITTVHGLRVTTASRTFVDLAADLPLCVVVAFGDYAIRHGLATAESIAACLADCAGNRGIRRARQAASLLDPRAESPRESILRITLIEGGLPGPVAQYVVRRADGGVIARLDLAYVEERIAIEYDGSHHLTPTQQAKDADRRHELTIDGWLIVTLTAADLRQPGRAVRKVDQALQHRRA